MRTHPVAGRLVIGFLIALVVVAGGAPTPATAQRESGFDTLDALPPLTHPIVGTWLATMGNQTGHATFTADGTVTMSLAPIHYDDPGMVHTSPAIGTWEPMGDTGATFTVVQRIWPERGDVALGTATITGYVVLDDVSDTLLDDGRLTTIILRDEAGGIVSVRTADTSAPFLTATRRPATEIEAATSNKSLPMPQSSASHRPSGCATAP